MGETGLNEIPYFEYRVINQILHGHLDTLGSSLRAVIAFGPMITSGNIHDIDLLEVIENWEGPSRMQAESTVELPMLGRLYLNFISLHDFESLALASSSSTPDVKELFNRVLDGWEIFYENPHGFARDTLAQVASEQKQRQGGALLSNPLLLPVTRP